jgi:enoyl-CoA hydratase/carnithine racemase
MGDYQGILVERNGGIAKVILNRPHVLNALNKQTLEEITAVFNEMEKDDSVQVVILAGTGRAFCAGDDIKEMKNKDVGFSNRAERPLNRAQQAIEGMSKVVIAAVHGYCYTGALDLILSCDMVIASENAVFADTHVRFGVPPGAGASQRLPRIVGIMKAKEMFLTCDPITAREAERLGLLNKVVADENLGKAAEEMAQKIMKNDQYAVRVFKELINKGMRGDLDSGLKIEASQFDEFVSGGHAKGQK